MITTSLQSRGLDFAPDVKHVTAFIVYGPSNTMDFLHCAGGRRRSARLLRERCACSS